VATEREVDEKFRGIRDFLSIDDAFHRFEPIALLSAMAGTASTSYSEPRASGRTKEEQIVCAK
jgi:hypothetical protein